MTPFVIHLSALLGAVSRAAGSDCIAFWQQHNYPHNCVDKFVVGYQKGCYFYEGIFLQKKVRLCNHTIDPFKS
jgi:hypothetical protein